MKKKILGGIAVLSIAAVAAWNVNLNSQKSDLSDVSLANVDNNKVLMRAYQKLNTLL